MTGKRRDPVHDGEEASPGPAGPGPEVDPCAERLAELAALLEAERHRADENWDRYLRAEADLENVRKRNARLREEAVERQRRELLGRFLDVADNLERALAHGRADAGALIAGLEGTYRELGRILASEGVEPIAALEAAFDPALHEAVGVVPLPGGGAERVVAVERAGYTVHGALLRAARVIVGRPASDGPAGGPQARPDPTDCEGA